jgi:multidrug efflux pump subunit AcrA (membrane-fusion protein)
MSPRERTSLIVGMMAGIAVAFALFVVVQQVRVYESFRTEHFSPEPENPVSPPPNTGSTEISTQITADEQEKIGLETTEIRRGSVYGEIATLGRVEELETAVHTISARVGGRIDRLFVNVGEPVQKGQQLALIYNGETAPSAEASQTRPVTVYSDAAGIVRARNTTEGRFVGAGEVLFALVDLSSVWVRADIFELDVARVRPGLSAQITSEALSGLELHGTVSVMESRADAQTGTTPVRIRVENPGMRLRPGMFVRSVLQVPLGTNVVRVPRTAVIDTGTEKIVYVVLDGGVFQRRKIQVGPPGKDHYPVVEGLAEGDKVVTNGAFLIDSQARRMGSSVAPYEDSGSLSEAGAPPGAVSRMAYRIKFRTTPDRPSAQKEILLYITVLDASGNPISDAQVRVTLIMPEMPSMRMPAMRNDADLRWNGTEYVGAINLAMAGSWNVVVEASRGLQRLATYRTRFDAH